MNHMIYYFVNNNYDYPFLLLWHSGWCLTRSISNLIGCEDYLMIYGGKFKKINKAKSKKYYQLFLIEKRKGEITYLITLKKLKDPKEFEYIGTYNHE